MVQHRDDSNLVRIALVAIERGVLLKISPFEVIDPRIREFRHSGEYDDIDGYKIKVFNEA
jgi:hypothetical protein